MKKLISLFAAILFILSVCVGYAEESPRTLVVYFDYSENMGDLSGMDVDAITSASLNAKTENTQGNLQVMAQTIQAATGADMFPIHVEETHAPRYLDMVMGAGDDQQNDREFTVINLPDSFDDYDTIYFGTPVWHAQLPQQVISFLHQVDFSGKQVVVFGIHLGSRWGRNLIQLRELQPGAEIVEGITVYASDANEEVRQETVAWLNGN